MTSKLLLFAAFVFSMLLMSINHRKRKKRIVFFGDSITKQGGRLGYGYIRLLQHFLQEAGTDEDHELASAGVAGDKVYDLYLRMGEDILAKGADIVVIFIGVNDTWHKSQGLAGTDINDFESFYIAIIEKLMAAAIKVVVCTPAVIGEKKAFASPEDEELDQYSNVIRKLASQYELSVVDIRKAFVDFIAANNTEDKDQGVLTTDKVHLNSRGNQLVAEEMWKVLNHIK